MATRSIPRHRPSPTQDRIPGLELVDASKLDYPPWQTALAAAADKWNGWAAGVIGCGQHAQHATGASQCHDNFGWVQHCANLQHPNARCTTNHLATLITARRWKLKAFAVYAAPFEEVLFLDSDATPALDPQTLFEHPRYRVAGSMFWPDIW